MESSPKLQLKFYPKKDKQIQHCSICKNPGIQYETPGNPFQFEGTVEDHVQSEMTEEIPETSLNVIL